MKVEAKESTGSSSTFIVNVEGLIKLEEEDSQLKSSSPSKDSDTNAELEVKQFEVPNSTTLESLKEILVAQGYKVNSITIYGIQELVPQTIKVSEDDTNCYDTNSESGLMIERNTTFLDFYLEWLVTQAHTIPSRSYHSKESESKIDSDHKGIEVGGVKIKLHRTLRVPDNTDTHILPPGLGTFPLVSLASAQNVPEGMKEKGGWVTPLFQREAMWMSFSTNKSKRSAMKVSVGGINAISNINRAKDPKDLDPAVQDYIVPGLQPWLDGICTEPNTVRQFVAMPLGSGYTIEEQLTGKAEVGGIQFDLFARVDDYECSFSSSTSTSELKPILARQTPIIANLSPGVTVTMTSDVKINLDTTPIKFLINADTIITANNFGRILLTVETLTGKIMNFSVDSDLRIENLKKLIELEDGTPQDQQRLIYDAAEQLEDGRCLRDYDITTDATLELLLIVRGGGFLPNILGIAAGGKFEQSITLDSYKVSDYEPEPTERVFIHTVNSQMWETLFGVLPPNSSITPETYQEYDLPWFDLYSEEPSTNQAGQFQNVQSIAAIDEIKSKLSSNTTTFDPSNPPPCSVHSDKKAIVVFRPCDHVACESCLFATVDALSTCVTCKEKVKNYTGFQVRIDQKKLEELKAREGERTIQGVTVDQREERNVITLFQKGDEVSRLKGSTKKHARDEFE